MAAGSYLNLYFEKGLIILFFGKLKVIQEFITLSWPFSITIFIATVEVGSDRQILISIPYE